jgi:hypothetical protein
LTLGSSLLLASFNHVPGLVRFPFKNRPGVQDRDQGARPDAHEGLAPAPRHHLSPRRRGSAGPSSTRRHPWRSVDPRRRLDLGLHTHRRPVKSRPETSSVVPSSAPYSSAACTSTPASSSVALSSALSSSTACRSTPTTSVAPSLLSPRSAVCGN